MKNSMMLITSSWKEQKTFKMIPTDMNCPFVECIYDNEVHVLAVVGKSQKNTFHMLPKIDANGDVELRKTPSREGKPFKEERRSIETYQEYYFEDESEIEEFIKLFAFNADTFEYKQYFKIAE
jgi:hypothetical protein